MLQSLILISQQHQTLFTYKARIISLTDSELIIQEYDDMNVNLADDYSKFSRH